MVRTAFRNLWVLSFCLISAAGSISAGQDQQQMIMSDGQKQVGQLVGITSDGIQFNDGNEIQNVAFEKLSELVFENAAVERGDDTPEYLLHLVDGSVLKLQTLGISKRLVTGALANGMQVEVNRANAHSLQLNEHREDSQLRKSLKGYLQRLPESGDELVIFRDEQLQSLEGIVGEYAEGKVGFTMETQSANVSLKKLEGLLFYHAAQRDFLDPVCQVQLNDGSRLLARSISAEDKSDLQVIAVCGAEFKIPRNRIASANFALFRNVYLDQLEPSTIDWQPLIASGALKDYRRKLKLPRINRDYKGQPLTLSINSEELGNLPETRSFEHGFAMAGGARLSFLIAGRFKRLTGQIGFAPQANAAGRVMLKIRGDGRTIFAQELSADVSGNPLDLDLPIVNVQRLTFQIDYHDGRSIGDNVHLVDIKASK